ncbi:glycosyltransferase family 4 protein [Candidatus Pandoraea novymonadis]|uniref:N, N'-diacetylbacillosaminyl-diphospho-undecaprenol alpha-1,3-N-acetylgalactosaminyltransferase n=1 Tax=Candidatus Pandoraea novymonadis TaxID=1808959 RepID=A0ABX5FH64_9BURK|nr:glycosyltransferase family 4 protein [Candidatus Pandoraea novymonadis]PSB92347.1 N,N'-diacetylbacillosaminyl-diphospho-undecaprenol alpha-1,3-N-acetylgalactosaminyltransferase [Candidatus Pandoraea novymonadis]
MTSSAPVLLCSNTFWSIYNFRRGAITAMLSVGHPVHVAAAATQNDTFAPMLRAIGCIVHEIPMAANGKNPLQDLILVYRLYRLYRHIKPRVVFHYTIKPNIYGSIVSHWAGIPSVSVTTGLGYVFINDSITTHIVRGLYRYAFRHTDENWFLNQEDLRTFVSEGLVAQQKTRLLPGEGINLYHFDKSPWPSDETPFRFLLICRLLRDKGVIEYVEAARALKRELPNVICQILGPADVSNPSRILRETIDGWQLQGSIEYLDTTSDVRPFIAAAQCIVLPSYREGLPRTLLEAGALCRPIITSDAPGCRDVVDDGITGWKVPVRDTAALTTRMRMVARLPRKELQRIGNAGRAKVAREFSEHRVIAQYLRILTRIN